MKIVRSAALSCLSVILLLSMAGCGKKEVKREAKVGESRSIDEVKAEAQKMDAKELRAMALKYKEALAAKQTELDKIAAKLDKLSPTELVEAAKSIQPEMDKLAGSIAALKERFQIYYQKLKEKSGDVSGLEI